MYVCERHTHSYVRCSNKDCAKLEDTKIAVEQWKTVVWEMHDSLYYFFSFFSSYFFLLLDSMLLAAYVIQFLCTQRIVFFDPTQFYNVQSESERKRV